MSATDAVVVYGATGHTGRFIVDELGRHGFTTVVSGRDATRLEPLAGERGIVAKPAGVDDPDALDRWSTTTTSCRPRTGTSRSHSADEPWSRSSPWRTS